MEWVIVNPSSIHEVCGLLGHKSANGEYVIKKESSSDAMDELIAKLMSDDLSLRTRRSIAMTQVVSKDLIPLLIAASSDYPNITPKVIKLMSLLTSPIECLVSGDFMATEEGQQVVYEVESILKTIKVEFTEFKVTKAVVDYLKGVTDKVDKLTPEECEGVSDGLLLLRNILHIPHKDSGTQHQILWNLFAHSVDKVLINLMNCQHKNMWGIALVQLIALIYKDQHVAHLQKILNMWLENSLSESSEMSEDLDNESNTSPPDHSSSPTLTSDPTSDSSDTGTNASKSNNGQNLNIGSKPKQIPSSGSSEMKHGTEASSSTRKTDKPNPVGGFKPAAAGTGKEKDGTGSQKNYSKAKSKDKPNKKDKMSDVDSGISSSHFSTDKHTMIEEMEREDNQNNLRPLGNSTVTIYNPQESNSTSSNEDDPRVTKTLGTKQKSKHVTHSHPVKLAPLKPTPVVNTQDKREIKRKKLHKRSKRAKATNRALIHHNATEEDISHVLREFTVDFLLKGYGSLVSVLLEQLCHNTSLQMDKSHFLWLITYFLKFASQMELDLEHICPVLSQKILSYLTYEGVAMCENLAVCKDDLKPHLRRMHLVVTALREFVQAVEIYSQLPSCSSEDKEHISCLQNQMLSLEELRNLFLLLIRYFKPGVQSKQYLQDLIVTNHVFLLLLEKISTHIEDKEKFSMCNFVKEFSSPLIMQQYGHLLEDFQNNGEFVNDCVFTMMHHIAGDLGCPEALYQPSILKTFSNIWEVEFSIRDDWADLIEYVIQRFMKSSSEEKKQIFKSGTSNDSDDNGWSKEDFNNLYWYYSKCSTLSDPIAKILELYGESASGKTRESILNQLLQQKIIGYNQFLKFLASEKAEAGDSDGAATDGSISTTSSSHATAGSSRHSVSPTIPLEECFNTTDPFSFSKVVFHDYSHDETHIEDQEPPMAEISFSTPRDSSPIAMDHEQVYHSTFNHECNGNSREVNNGSDSIEIAIGELVKQLVCEGHDLTWLQNQILEACYVKFTMELKGQNDEHSKAVTPTPTIGPVNGKFELEFNNAGPIPYHYSLLGQSIPIIPWTHWQEILLRSPLYLLLLHKLGFHLPCDVGKLFPRIPHFWTADVLLSVAGKLGPLPEKEKLKFDPNEVMNATITKVDVHHDGVNNLGIDITEEASFKMPSFSVGGGCVSGHSQYGFGSTTHSVNWMNLVHKSKQFIERHSEPCESSSTSSSSIDEEEEQIDECSSLKALPPTDNSISEQAMMSQESGQEDYDIDISTEAPPVTVSKVC